jgi:fumarate reductase subunit C
MAIRRPYVRPVAGWWRRDPFFMRYMAREATALFVALYALMLLAGLVRLAQGEAAFDGWLAAMRSREGLALHVLLLAVFAYHTYSWFAIMPKTMAPLSLAGRRIPAWAITAGGIAAALACSAALIAFARILAR